MTWSSLVLLGIGTILVVVLCDLVVSGGRWWARFAERVGLIARSVRPRESDRRVTALRSARTELSRKAGDVRRGQTS